MSDSKKVYGFRLTQEEIEILEKLDPTGQSMAINGLRVLLLREAVKME